MTKDQFGNFPDLSNDWPNNFQAGWNTDITNFWTGAGYHMDMMKDVQPGMVARVSDLIGWNIADAANHNKMGAVKDTVIDLQNGQVRYVVMSFDDTGTYGDGWVLVPYSAFDPTAFANGQLMFNQNFDNNLLVKAPRFNQNDFYNIDLTNPTWDSQVQAYWKNNGFNVF